MNNMTVLHMVKDRNENVVKADLNEVKLKDGGLVCPCVMCGRVFSEPVFLTNLSNGSNVETYYACPYCFSKLKIDGVLDDAKSFGVKKGKTAKEGVDVKLDKFLNAQKCTRFVGYLKSRPSNSAIPDECLTCPKILQCMV